MDTIYKMTQHVIQHVVRTNIRINGIILVMIVVQIVDSVQLQMIHHVQLVELQNIF